MRTTITIRADDDLRQALARKAESEHKTVSQLIREILEEALVERPLAERLGGLRGRLRLENPRGGWEQRIRERNWRS